MDTLNVKENAIALLKFIIFTVFSIFLIQFIKNPIEISLLNSGFLKDIPFGFFYILALSIPSILFYLIMGVLFSFIIKKNVYTLAVCFCLIVYLLIFAFLRPYVRQPDLYGYLIIYLPKIVIPLAMFAGIWLKKKFFVEKNK